MSNLTETPSPSLLSPQALDIVRATAATVAAHADEITAHFYPRMFAAHPELLRIFNQGNQATGEQSKALAGSVVAYAVQLIDPEAASFDHVMRRIAYKHVSLGIRPEQYTIVGEHLLASVAEVLGDAVTPEIAAAWSEVYWLFALQLVAEEARLYQQANTDPSPPTSSPSSWNRQTEVRSPASRPDSTSRCSSICLTATGSPGSTPCLPPRCGHGCRSPYDGFAARTAPPTVAYPAISMIMSRSETCSMSAAPPATSY
jgi:hemoglobin-like flavoprotein